MGIFDRGRKRGIPGGIEGTALILESEVLEVGESDGRGGQQHSLMDDVASVLERGSSPYRLKLRVEIGDDDAYEIDERFKVPRKAEVTGLTSREHLRPGLELPVRVDPEDRTAVAVDWDQFIDSPERKRAMRQAEAAAQHRAVKKQMEANPELQATLQAGNKSAVMGWAGAVRGGQMSREKFDETVQLEVACGRMDPADAEAARRTLD